MNKKNTKVPMDTLPVVPAREKASPFHRDFAAFIRKMKTTTRNTKQASLLQAVTPAAKREAESLGISLAQYVANLAAEFDTRPVTLRFTDTEIRRMNAIVDGGKIHEWLTNLALAALDGAGGVLNGNRITLDLDPKMAADLREAAAFEEMSVAEYLLDGLRRDLALSEDIQAISEN